MACNAHNGGMMHRIQRGAPGHASNAPSSVPAAKENSVVRPSSPIVQGSASRIMLATVRG